MSFLRAGFKKDIFLWNLPRTERGGGDFQIWGDPPQPKSGTCTPPPPCTLNLYGKHLVVVVGGGTPIRPNNYFD